MISIRSIMVIVLIVVSNFSFLYSQTLDILPFPFVKSKPAFVINSANDGIGMLEFAITDQVRDGFLNPAKLGLNKNNIGVLSATNVWLSKKFNYSSNEVSPSLNYTSKSKFYYNNIPVGGIYQYGSSVFGGTFSYIISGYESENSSQRSIVREKYKNESQEKGFDYNISAMYAISDVVSFGVGLQGTNLKRLSESFSLPVGSSWRDTSKIYENYYKSGLKVNTQEFGIIYILGIYYEADDDYSIWGSNNRGWLVQSDYYLPVNNNLNLSSRITFDKRKIDDTDLDALQIGIGSSYSIENIKLGGEIIYEPAWSRYEYIPTQVYEEGFVYKHRFTNWRTRFGIDLVINDWLSCRVGFDYLRYNNESSYYTKTSGKYTNIKPNYSTGITNLTTGFKVEVDNFDVIYNLLYNSNVLFRHNPMLYTETFSLDVYNPITNRLSVIYKY